MNTRESFEVALNEVRRYEADSAERRPAFVYRLGEMKAATVDALLTAECRPMPSTENRVTVAGAKRLVRGGRVKARDLVEQALRQVRRSVELNAFVHVMEAEARKEAEALDNEQQKGKLRGPLHGIPIAVKDVIHVAGAPTTASSKVMTDVKATYDAASVARLRGAGAVILGKTTTHEFALGVTTPQSRNPWDPGRIPGGSSGGSAIAVATGMSLGALGTDTRASIRIPAALSGVVGFKPTFGLVSTWGVVPLSWSMDHVGPLTSTVEDAALLLNVLVGHDPRDPSSSQRRPSDYSRYLGRRLGGVKIGVPAACLSHCVKDVLEVFARAEDLLRESGAQIVLMEELGPDELQAANAAGLIVSRCEAAAFHQPFFATRKALYSKDVFDQLDFAMGISAVDYLQAQRFRREFMERMLARFAVYDVIAMPTSPIPAPRSEESEMYLTVLSQNCVPWSFIGLPAVSVPCGQTEEGLPIGLQLVGPPFADGVLIAVASAFEIELARVRGINDSNRSKVHS